MDDLLADFLAEVNEGLGELDNALVTLERRPDDKPTLSLVFRHVHTIKGTCGFLGLPRLQRVAHAAEDVLGQLRDGALTPSPPVIDVVLAALDRIRAIVSSLTEKHDEGVGDDGPLLERLTLAAGGGLAAMPGTNTVTDDAAALTGESSETHQGGPVGTLRVAVNTLETLMTLVGELVLTRNQLLQIARAQSSTPFDIPLQRLSRLASELQEVATLTRMQPVGNAWNKLPRLVRDLSRDLGKQIVLETFGSETELDRQVLDLIRDPLTHVIRNASDHGIEMPDQRRKAGKPECGRIILRACHEGGHIVITITDDGKGLDLEAIRRRCIDRGLASETDLATMSRDEIARFIFLPGFSTASAVTNLSGRGVGMDVVRSNVEQIGGSIGIASEFGHGTVITIRIPLTLAIVPGLLLEAAGERFVLPQLAITELVRPRNDGSSDARIERVGDSGALRLRDRLLPLVCLKTLLDLSDPKATTDTADEVVVVIRAPTGSYGLLVDRIVDTEEIVVKPLVRSLHGLPHFGGVTILGDGTPTMVLEPTGMARAADIQCLAQDNEHAAPRPTVATAVEALLVVRIDDELCALPLALVTRIESLSATLISRSGGRRFYPYGNTLLPIVSVNGTSAGTAETALVLGEAGDAIGLVVDEIVEIVELAAPDVAIRLGDARPGILGITMLGGDAVARLDADHFRRVALASAAAKPQPVRLKTATRKVA